MRMTSPVSTVNRIMAGLVCLMTLLLLILQVDSSAIHREQREVPKPDCFKLEFWSDGHKRCLPCHLCGPEVSDPKAIRNECKGKNPQPITHHGGKVAWCDNPTLPLPECPPLPENVSPSNKTTRCTEGDREYAPGCECIIGCGGRKSLTLHCTQDLTWSGATVNEIEECQGPITTTTLQPPTTETPRPVAVKKVDHLVAVLSSAIALTIIVTIVVVIVVACVCKRRQCSKITSNQNSPSSSENSSELGADSPLISEKSRASVKSPGSGSQSISDGREGQEVLRGASEQPLNVTSLQVVREVSSSAPGDNSREENAVQTRQAEPDFPKAVLHIDLSKKHQENDQQIKALREFLKSRNELEKFTKMFDQKYDFGQITWHNVAHHLLNWNRDDVKSSEYLRRPNASSSPGDGCMYLVMTEALHEGKGLLDLLNCLQRFDSPNNRNYTAEKQLSEFWEKWKAKHARQE